MYKPVPPRPKKTDIIRSRSGCQSCRRRKTKCDELKPTCGTCARLGKTCQDRKLEFRFRVVTGPPSTHVSRLDAEGASSDISSEPESSDGIQLANLDIIRSLQHTERDIFYSTYWENQCLPALHPVFHSVSRLITDDEMLKNAVLALSSCNLSRLHAEQRTQPVTSISPFSPSLIHQTRSQLYYSSAIRRFASLGQADCQANATLSLTVLVLFAYIESSMGNLYGFSCHVQGLSGIFSEIHDVVTKPEIKPLLSAWMQVRFVVWWARAYFSSIEVLQKLPSIILPRALGGTYTTLHDRRISILSIMCESHRLNFQAALKHWTCDNTFQHPKNSDPQSLLAKQSRRLDQWLAHLPPSEQPILFNPQTSYDDIDPITFLTHDSTLNFAYYLISRIMTSPSFLSTLPSKNLLHLGHECLSSEPFINLLLCVLNGTNLHTSLTRNNYTIGFSGLLLAALLRCQNHSLALQIQSWLESLLNLHPTEEGAFPVYQTLGVARAINRQREEGFDVFAISLPVDDGGGSPKFTAYNSQSFDVLLFHGKYRGSGTLGTREVVVGLGDS